MLMWSASILLLIGSVAAAVLGSTPWLLAAIVVLLGLVVGELDHIRRALIPPSTADSQTTPGIVGARYRPPRGGGATGGLSYAQGLGTAGPRRPSGDAP
jgi:MFS family permease